MKQRQHLTRGIAVGVILALSAPAALATEAAARVDLNVRTGPGTSFGVVDTLDAGERVEVVECQPNAWCYVDHAGPNGWVSSTYLRNIPAPAPGGGALGSNCKLQFTVGPDGPKLAVVCEEPEPEPAPEPDPTPVVDRACFFREANYRGAHFCFGIGNLNRLSATYNDKISSISLEGAVRARVCTDRGHEGTCRTITSDTPMLGRLLNDRISSLRVFMADPMPEPTPPRPSTHSTGRLDIASSYTADLDRGLVAGGGADIWHHAINAAVRRLEPQNGAKLALGDGSNRGYAGCLDADFSSASLPFASLTEGTYVCVKTSAGRISQFRVNGYSGTTLRIGYTTWSN
ncbi:SH3 domain-containing protein [Aliiroseovarius subalbicans]|uniref:SH3 domain-containing protein n=1 Tax=Aliiroseovarius subalbicans TaxID=2925840 RepID=UPI001F58D989|nr:SH3 domain-containing protein [Aliiroseovarius subalbicans]MCI2399369.1 SH3 domain-containing protein [Aliiroseovarius subalbicans]